MTTARSAKAEATRSRLVDATLLLVQRHGFNGAGLASILAESDVPRGSLYFHFPGGKDELVTEALKRSGEEYRVMIDGAFADAADVPSGLTSILRSLADMMARGDFAVGCPVSAVTLDTGLDNAGLREVCTEIYQGWVDTMARWLSQFGIQNPQMLASALVSLVEGVLVTSRARHDVTPFSAAEEMIELLFRSASSSTTTTVGDSQ